MQHIENIWPALAQKVAFFELFLFIIFGLLPVAEIHVLFMLRRNANNACLARYVCQATNCRMLSITSLEKELLWSDESIIHMEQ